MTAGSNRRTAAAASAACLLALLSATSIAFQKGQEQKKPEGEGTPAGRIVVDGGFQAPESAIHDGIRDEYLVSNINGELTASDDNGFISRVSPEGKIIELRWIDAAMEGVTLHAPKGMAVTEGILLVADLEVVRLFDRATGQPRGEWPVPDAQFLNDIAVAPDGMVWVTDTGLPKEGGKPVQAWEGAIYRIGPAGAVDRVAKGPELQGPNGIVITAAGPVFVTFFDKDIMRVDGVDPIPDPMTIVTLPQGQLDGLVALGDHVFLVSSWAANGVYLAGRTVQPELVAENIGSPADIGLDAKRHRLLIPALKENRLYLVDLPERVPKRRVH